MKSHCLLFIVTALTLKAAAQEDPVIIQTKHTETLIPEGIAVDTQRNAIYVSSIAQQKIIRINTDGSHTDFVPSGAEGFGQGLGLKVDNPNNIIWAVSNKKEDKFYITQLYTFDLVTGHVRNKFIIKDTINHFMNDVIPDGKGKAYTTATETGEIFQADIQTGKITLFINDTLIKYPNGIELHGNNLYIATYGSGLLVYDLSQKKLQQLKGYTDKAYAYNLDGLGLYKYYLLGVYNGAEKNSDNAIVMYELNETGTAIVQENVLYKGHALFHEPTTLSVAGNKIYVLANSHLRVYNKNKESVKGIEQQLTPVTVLVSELKQ